MVTRVYSKASSSSQCDLVLPLSVFNFRYPPVSLRSWSSCLRLLPRLPITYIFSHLYLYIIDVFCKAVPTQDVTNPVSLPSFLLYVGYSSSGWLCNSSFLTRSVELIFSILFPAPHFKSSHLYVPVSYVKRNGTAEGPWFDSCPGTGIFPFFMASTPVSGSTQSVMDTADVAVGAWGRTRNSVQWWG